MRPASHITVVLPTLSRLSVKFIGTVRLSDTFILHDVLFILEFTYNPTFYACSTSTWLLLYWIFWYILLYLGQVTIEDDWQVWMLEWTFILLYYHHLPPMILSMLLPLLALLQLVHGIKTWDIFLLHVLLCSNIVWIFLMVILLIFAIYVNWLNNVAFLFKQIIMFQILCLI